MPLYEGRQNLLKSFNQNGDISTRNGRSLKRTSLPTENDINTRLGKAWIAIDRLWKIDIANKIKCNVFQAAVVVWMHVLDAD